MKHSFWEDKWESQQIGFHNPAVHPLLEKHMGDLGLSTGARVFLPLCGKTLDIHWLLAKGFRVCGAELVETAVQDLFRELGVTPSVTQVGDLRIYQAEHIDIFAGDIFKLTAEALGSVDAVYDRAALVALPRRMRIDYTSHIAAITDNAPQLLISFDYNQAEMDGPPFSVPGADIREYYQSPYTAALLGRYAVAGGLKGKCAAKEDVWRLTHTPVSKPS